MFRIPSVVARRALMLAFCEGRLHGSGDAGEIEVVLRRSLDGGRTWLPLQVVSAVPGMTCGNPVPVIDPVSDPTADPERELCAPRETDDV